MRGPRCARPNRIVVNVVEGARSSPRPAGILMDRSEPDARIAGNNRLCAVTVMRIEIPDRDPFNAVRQRVERCHRDVVEVAKPHRALAHCVMAWRAHEAECGYSRARNSRDFQRSTRGAEGMMKNVRVSRAIGIEIICPFANALDVASTVGALQRGVAGHSRQAPLPLRVAFT